MREFAEQELVIPTGPFAGRRFRVHRQPWAGLWLDAIDSRRWRRHWHTGGQQGGKTLLASVLPVLYHIFEIEEDVIFGVPSLDMVMDKWNDDLFPAIEASRYRDLLPRTGRGSKGGTPSRVEFGNGVGLRFMTAGGGDKARAGKTGRVLVTTEADGFDEVGGSSREADKFSQLEGRLSAFGDQAVLYAECTLSTDDGRTYKEIKAGTDSRIAIRCPHCRHFVTPERDHLIGWKDQPDVLSASDNARTVCPKCGATWTEEDRRTANLDARLVHAGQEIDQDGIPTGSPKRTNTLGFRWTAANNLLRTQGEVGAAEWKASRESDDERGEKVMRQFYWALPHVGGKQALTKLEAHAITLRMGEWKRNELPPDTVCITCGIDLGDVSDCHYTAIAWRPGGTPHVIEYERLNVPSNELGVEMALMKTLRGFRDDVVMKGWEDAKRKVVPVVAFVDSGKWTQTAYAFCAESGLPFFPAKGFGTTQAQRMVELDGVMLRHSPQDNGIQLFDINADVAKNAVHNRLKQPADKPGALTLFKTSKPADHLTFAHHLLAERVEQEFVPGRGLVTKMVPVRRQNHYLDSTALAYAAGQLAGQGVIAVGAIAEPETPMPVVERNPINAHRGRW